MNDAREIAINYIRRGWSPIPLPPRSKKPHRTLIDWPKLRLVETDVQSWFKANSNVGVLNGGPSCWQVDIDLDHELARELADDFLPATGSEFGRKSARRSHRLFIVTSPIETKQFQLSRDEMVVEIRSTGSQTVFPGSIHKESGEPIEWDKDGAPTVIDPAQLKDRVVALFEEVKRKLGTQPPPEFTNGHTTNGVAPSVTLTQRSDSNALDRCRKYVDKIPGAISGQGGHRTTFYVACTCFRFGLTDDQAWLVLSEYNAKCEPEWSQKELRHKLTEGRKIVEKSGQTGKFAHVDPPPLVITAMPNVLPDDLYDNSETLLEQARCALGDSCKSLVRIKKYGKADSTWGLVFQQPGGTIEVSVGTTEDLHRHDKVYARLIESEVRPLITLSGDQKGWRNRAARIVEAAELVETSTEAEQTEFWLQEFITSKKVGVISRTEPDAALDSLLLEKPHEPGSFRTKSGTYYISVREFARVLNEERRAVGQSTVVGIKDLALRLAQLGFQNKSLCTKHPDTGKVFHRRFWAGSVNE